MYIKPNKKKIQNKRLFSTTIIIVVVGIIVLGIVRIHNHGLPSFLHFAKKTSPIKEVPLAVATIPSTDSSGDVSGISEGSVQTPTVSLPSIKTIIPKTTVSASTNPLVLNYQVGVAFGNTLINLNSVDLNKRLDDITSLGIGWIRFDLAWDDVQYKDSKTYDWSSIDRIVDAANAHHLKILANLAYTPKWARSPGCVASNDTCPPADLGTFSLFAQAAAKRYTSKGIVTWEIWNEPNIGKFWEPAPNPFAYTKLLKLCYTAIKAINPTATVLSGGLAPAVTSSNRMSPTDFLALMYLNGAKPYFDGLGDHPYSFPAPPSMYYSWSGWSQMSQTPVSLRSIMALNGDSSKKIWMTEYGAPTGGPGNIAWVGDTDLNSSVDHDSVALQAETITEGITSNAQSSWAGPIFIYSYKDLGTSSDTVENFFGIISNNGSVKPVYDAIKKLLVK